MKKFFTFAVMFAAVAMVACGGQQKPAEAEAEAAVEAIEAAKADLMAGNVNVFDAATFTVGGAALTVKRKKED